MEVTPKEHIERIRRTKFSIGGELNPLREDLHHATKNLSTELYAKDVHFLMELIQVSIPLTIFFLFHFCSYINAILVFSQSNSANLACFRFFFSPSNVFDSILHWVFACVWNEKMYR